MARNIWKSTVINFTK